jgi:hypothetical protein
VDDALRRMVADGVIRTSRHRTVERGQDETSSRAWAEIEGIVAKHRIELVVLHHYHDPTAADPRPFIAKLRTMPHRPVVALTCGDAFFDRFFRPSHPKIFQEACAEVDIVLSTSMGVMADAIVRYGAPRVALWPLGACHVRFGERLPPYRATEAPFDVVFIGSNNRPRNPLRSYHWYARRRERLVNTLDRSFGSRFAVFGHGWDSLPSARGPVAFEDQLRVCRQARVVVGGVPYSPARYYASNRPFIQILSGVPFVDIRVEGVERLLRDGEHWHLVEKAGEVVARCRALLAMSDQEREQLGRAAAEYVSSAHTQAARWRGLVRDLDRLHRSLTAGEAPSPPGLDFLLPEVDRVEELPLATRGW